MNDIDKIKKDVITVEYKLNPYFDGDKEYLKFYIADLIAKEIVIKYIDEFEINKNGFVIVKLYIKPFDKFLSVFKEQFYNGYRKALKQINIMELLNEKN